MGDSLLLALWRNSDFVLFCILEIRLFGGENIGLQEELFIKRFIVTL